MATTTHDAMYQSIGGAPGISRVVDHFYERLWPDPDLITIIGGFVGGARGQVVGPAAG
ncbi:MAG: hypothetical protein ACR2LK_13140 [Solirubrobacteraceae bacterium]